MDQPVHIRRCHICGKVNEVVDSKVEKCGHCHKSLAPFYYFDDRFTAIAADTSLRPPLMEGEYSPIQGLTAYWGAF